MIYETLEEVVNSVAGDISSFGPHTTAVIAKHIQMGYLPCLTITNVPKAYEKVIKEVENIAGFEVVGVFATVRG